MHTDGNGKGILQKQTKETKTEDLRYAIYDLRGWREYFEFLV